MAAWMAAGLPISGIEVVGMDRSEQVIVQLRSKHGPNSYRSRPAFSGRPVAMSARADAPPDKGFRLTHPNI